MKIELTGASKNPYINLAIHGRSGSGKTTFGGTSAKKFTPIVLSKEGGELCLARWHSHDTDP